MSRFVNTGFSTDSYVYFFEGMPYNYAELPHQDMPYMSMQTGFNKYEASSSGNCEYYSAGTSGQVDVEDVDIPYMVEEQEYCDEVEYMISEPQSPEESVRTHNVASSSQVYWENEIDVDNMTYEELLGLGEAVGTQNRGLSKELIASLPTSKYKSGGIFSRKKSNGDQCVICQMEYKRRERQMTLPCKHVYHAKCATKWLSLNKACPVCYVEVFGNNSRS
ncbi:RING-type E3 ubiquitin transferase [Ranunculus cassubicifolius]